MRGLNKIMLAGRLGKDPEYRVSNSGVGMATCSVATSDRIKNKDSGEYAETTDWHRVVIFGKSADFARDHTEKGDLVYVEGRMKHRKYTDKNSGQEKSISEVLASDFQLFSKKGSSSAEKPSFEKKTFGGKQEDSMPSFDSDVPF